MIRKISSLLILFLISFFLISCEPETSQANENDRNNIEESLNVQDETDQIPNADIPQEDEGTPEPETPVVFEDGAIRIHHIGNLTSRFAPYEAPAIRGLEDWAEQINAEGGILGRELELVFSESGGDIALAVSLFEEILNDDPIAVIVYQTAFAEAIIDLASKNDIPVINLGIDPVQQENEGEDFLFNFYVPYDVQFKFFIDHIYANWGELNPVTLDTGIRVAFFAWNDNFGGSALTSENRAYMTSLGIELVKEEYFFPSSVENIANPLVSAWDKGANVIYTNSYLHGPALILNNLHRLGLRQFFVFAGPSPAMDISSYGFLEFNTYLDGFISPYTTEWYSDENHSSVSLVNFNYEISERPIADKSQRRLISQGALDLLVDMIEDIGAGEGGEEINGEVLHQALANLENYEVLGGLFEVNFVDGQRTLDALHMRQVIDFLEFEIMD